ncbi:MAG: hypothetical protein ACRDGQ_08060, partial [Candidatus Limnocylindrales bacterium]
MDRTALDRATLADRFGWAATVLAGLAAALGLLTGVYRDVPAMIDQAKGTDLATLFVATPLLMASFWLVGRGSAVGRVIASGTLGYLVYTYAIFAFEVTINPLTIVYIAILALATWSLILIVGTTDASVAATGQHLPRRTTAAFLGIIAALFAMLWLGQIAAAMGSGILPVGVSDLHLPTSAVYALDLGFALPILAVAALFLVRGIVGGGPLALAGLVFVALMALSILGLFGMQLV